MKIEDDILMQDMLGDLKLMYELFARVPTGHTEMRMAIKSYIMQLGAEINNNINADLAGASSSKSKTPAAGGGGTQTAIRWVEQVLALQDKFDRILERSAANNKSFQTAFNEVSQPVRWIIVCVRLMVQLLIRHSNILSMKMQNQQNLFHYLLMRI